MPEHYFKGGRPAINSMLRVSGTVDLPHDCYAFWRERPTIERARAKFDSLFELLFDLAL
jgi:hypothetical protein